MFVSEHALSVIRADLLRHCLPPFWVTILLEAPAILQIA